MNKLLDVLELRNVSLTYDEGKSYIIKDFNLIIQDKPDQGQFLTLLGASGCGKSSILRFVSGLQKPTSGEIFFFEKPHTEQDRVGMVFQKYSSFPWLTVLENVELGLKIKGVSKKERKEKSMSMLEMVGLQDQHWKYAQYPTLSGGQLQRVAIARSLVSNPKILLLDEPFGALDIRTRLQMQELLCKLWVELSKTDEATTIILVTHDISEAVYLGDEIHIMGKAPSKIIDKIQVKLPLVRNREMKKLPYFKELVSQIEEKMMSFN